MTVDSQIRDRLKAVREQLKEARSRRAEANREVESARSAFGEASTEGAAKITEMPEFAAAEEAVRKRGTIDDEIADLKAAEAGIMQMLGEQAEANGGTPGQNPHEMRISRGWDGHRLTAAGSAYAQARDAGLFTSSNQFGTVQLGEICTREEATNFISPLRAEPPGAAPGIIDTPGASPGPYGGLIGPDRRGVVPPLLRPLRLLDLIPSGTTDSNVIEYVQVQAIPNAAAEVAEGAIKPQAGLTLADATAPVRTIPSWIKVNRQAMDDAAGLATMINTLLPHDVRRRIENQIIAGDGVGQNIKGITRQTGLGAPVAVPGDNVADAILRAMTVIILSDAEPNFAALHPISWQNLLLMRTAVGGANTGSYLYGGPGVVGPQTIWGLSITPSVVIDQAHPLVGDANGATLLFREGVNIKTSDSDQDDFIRNRVTVLAEARVALPVWRPASFAVAASG